MIDNLVHDYGGYGRLNETIKDLRRQMGRQLRDFLGFMRGKNVIFGWTKSVFNGTEWKFAKQLGWQAPLGSRLVPNWAIKLERDCNHTEQGKEGKGKLNDRLSGLH